jgi:hypothetical protein
MLPYNISNKLYFESIDSNHIDYLITPNYHGHLLS